MEKKGLTHTFTLICTKLATQSLEHWKCIEAMPSRPPFVHLFLHRCENHFDFLLQRSAMLWILPLVYACLCCVHVRPLDLQPSCQQNLRELNKSKFGELCWCGPSLFSTHESRKSIASCLSHELALLQRLSVTFSHEWKTQWDILSSLGPAWIGAMWSYEGVPWASDSFRLERQQSTGYDAVARDTPRLASSSSCSRRAVQRSSLSCHPNSNSITQCPTHNFRKSSTAYRPQKHFCFWMRYDMHVALCQGPAP